MTTTSIWHEWNHNRIVFMRNSLSGLQLEGCRHCRQRPLVGGDVHRAPWNRQTTRMRHHIEEAAEGRDPHQRSQRHRELGVLHPRLHCCEARASRGSPCCYGKARVRDRGCYCFCFCRLHPRITGCPRRHGCQATIDRR